MDGELWRLWQVLFVVTLMNLAIPSVKAASDPNEHLHAVPVFDVSGKT